MTFEIIKLLLGLIIILLGANILVDGSSSIARRFGLSEFLVGLTIVGIGTSTPEMVVSFISSIEGNSDLAVGNIVGSNIANILLILGVVAMVSPIKMTGENMKRDIPISVFAALLFFILSSDRFIFNAQFNTISRIDGILLFLCFIAFMYISFKFSKSTQNDINSTNNSNHSAPKSSKISISILLIILGLAGLIYGGRLFVNSGSTIAKTLGVSDAFIGITVMAVGTSIPELAASLVAAIKKRGQMALGNIIGSNISNIFLILGGSAIISPLTMSNITIIDLSMLILSSILIFVTYFSFKKKTIDRLEGFIFFSMYVGYICWLTSQL
jgi:cation:H+ antiporter